MPKRQSILMSIQYILGQFKTGQGILRSPRLGKEEVGVRSSHCLGEQFAVPA